MEPIIRTRSLCKIYGKKNIVDDVNLEIKCGEIYGLLGKNGVGKTTLMKMLTSLVIPTKGEIYLLGKALKEHVDILGHVGSVIEVPVFYYHLSAMDNLRIYCKYKEIDEKQIEKYLEMAGLSEERKQQVKEYSLGMKQRLGIVRAMLGEPKALILDEPINGLDPEGIRDVRNLLLHLAKECNTSILLSSHILGEIESTADRVGFMNKGKIIREMDKRMLEESEKLFKVEVENVETEIAKLQTMEVMGRKGNIIHIRSKETYMEFIQELLKANVNFKEVRVERATLEDIFMKIT